MRVSGAEIVASGGMFVFGIVVAMLGAVLPLVSEPLGLGLDSAGHLFLALNGAILVGSLAVGLVVDRFGFRGPLVLGPVVIALALVLVPAAGSFVSLVAAVTLLGLGGSTTNAGPNILVADLYGEPRAKNAALNRVGVFFGLGALFLPFLMGALLGHLGLRSLLLVAAGLAAVVGLGATLPRLPPAKRPHGSSVGETLGLLTHPTVAVLGAVMFFDAGSEMLTCGYLTTFLTRKAGASVQEASWVLAGYWLALMAARVLLGRLLLKVPGEVLLPLTGAGAAAALGLVSLEPTLPVTAALFILTPFFYAGVIPTALGLAGAAEPQRSGAVFGLLFSISVVGAMLVPWVGGQLAAVHGLRVVPLLGAAGFALVVAFSLWARRLRTETPAPTTAEPQTPTEGR